MMMKLVLAFFMAVLSGLSFSQTAADTSPWEKIGENRWELPFSREDASAVIRLEVKDHTMHFTLQAECKQPGKVASLKWKKGDVLARGKDCLGTNHTLETESLEGWIKPLPLEVRGRGGISSERKKKDIRRMRTLTPKELMRLV